MDHRLIDECQVADRYLMGKLSAGEQAEFEEHYLDCPACLERLESIEGLRAGLKELFPAKAASRKAGAAARVLFFRRPGGVALLAAACLLVAALPPVLFLGKYRRAAGEIASARAAAEEARKEKAALTQVLERERIATAGAAAALPAVSAFSLNLTRGAGPGAPLDRILLRDAREWIVLLLDRPGAPRGAGVQARLATPDGRPIGDALAANEASGDMLAVSIPPGVLTEGEYVLTLEGAGPAPARELATYRFRAAPRK